MILGDIFIVLGVCIGYAVPRKNSNGHWGNPLMCEIEVAGVVTNKITDQGS